MVFDQGCTTFNPITVILILNCPDLFYFGVVNVLANNALMFEAFSFTHLGFLEITDQLKSVFNLNLKMGGQGPVTHAE